VALRRVLAVDLLLVKAQRAAGLGGCWRGRPGKFPLGSQEWPLTLSASTESTSLPASDGPGAGDPQTHFASRAALLTECRRKGECKGELLTYGTTGTRRITPCMEEGREMCKENYIVKRGPNSLT